MSLSGLHCKTRNISLGHLSSRWMDFILLLLSQCNNGKEKNANKFYKTDDAMLLWLWQYQYPLHSFFCPFFLPVSLRHNWHTALNKFNVYNLKIWLNINHEMTLAIKFSEKPSSYRYKIKEIEEKFSLWWQCLGFTLNDFHI